MKRKDLRGKAYKSEQGAWVKAPADGDFAGIAVKVRGLQTQDARRRRLQLIADPEVMKRRIGPSLDPADEDRIEATILHECVLLDWKGIEDEGGEGDAEEAKAAEGNAGSGEEGEVPGDVELPVPAKELPYSKKAAREMLFDPDYRAFRDFVRISAAVVEGIGVDSIEAERGNSSPS